MQSAVIHGSEVRIVGAESGHAAVCNNVKRSKDFLHIYLSVMVTDSCPIFFPIPTGCDSPIDRNGTQNRLKATQDSTTARNGISNGLTTL